MEKKRHFLSWYFEFNLLYRILIGLILGAVLGLVLQDNILWVQPFGTLFIRLLTMIMVPLILSTLIVGASSVSPATLGRVGIRIMLLYLITSAFAVALGMGMGAIFRPQAILGDFTAVAGRAVATAPLSQILLDIVPNNVAASIVNAQLLPIIFFALIFGLSLSYLRISNDERLKGIGNTVYNFFDGVAEAMMKMIKGIMEYAPIGVFALVSVVFATAGPRVIGALGLVVAACFTGYIIHVVVVYLLILLKGYGRLSISRFVSEAKNPFFTAFVTRSSGGTLPVTIQAAENLGIKKDVYSFSLPLGATINMDGTAIYQGVAATFIALTVWGHGFSGGQIGTVVLTATLASIGTAGVPGAGAIMLLMVLSAVGLPVVDGTAVAGAYAMVLGIDAILDMGRTALNVTGDLVVTTCVSKNMNMIDLDKWR